MEDRVVFDWMNINEVMAHVEINRVSKTVKCIEYSDKLPYMFLAKRPHTIESVLSKFESRCFSKGRPDKDEILESMGLRQYSPYDIVRFTHGHTNRDDLWVRFEGEDLEYFKDINVMRPSLLVRG